MRNHLFLLNIDQALFIRQLRVEMGYTWRSIASEVAETYPELHALRGNQIDGMRLCDDAMTFLNEKVEDGWN